MLQLGSGGAVQLRTLSFLTGVAQDTGVAPLYLGAECCGAAEGTSTRTPRGVVGDGDTPWIRYTSDADRCSVRGPFGIRT